MRGTYCFTQLPPFEKKAFRGPIPYWVEKIINDPSAEMRRVELTDGVGCEMYAPMQTSFIGSMYIVEPKSDQTKNSEGSELIVK